jgi:hypothetical protein
MVQLEEELWWSASEVFFLFVLLLGLILSELEPIPQDRLAHSI